MPSIGGARGEERGGGGVEFLIGLGRVILSRSVTPNNANQAKC